jgi:hypothetical protein
MKQHIKNKYKFQLEMVPLGCHQRNAAKVAVRNFKAHFLKVCLREQQTHFPYTSGTDFCLRPKLHSTYYANQTPHPTCRHMHTC